MIHSQHRLGIIMALGVTLLASAGWVFTKVALRELDPFSFIAWRFFLAGLVLLPFCWHQLRVLSRHDYLMSALLGMVLGIAICIWIEGMNRIAFIGEAAFIISLSVVIIPLISCFYGNPLSRSLYTSIIVAVCGLYFLTGANGFQLEAAQLILLVSAFCFSLHIVMLAQHTKTIPSLASTAVQLLIAALIAFIISAYTGTFAQTLQQIISNDLSQLTWLMWLGSALLATSVRFGLQTKALSLISSIETSMIFSLGPIWTASLGWLILAESMTRLQLFGCALIFSAQIFYRLGQAKK